MPAKELKNKLEKFASSLSIRNMAITYVPSINDEKSEMHLNKIAPQTKNTIIVYNNRIVADKFVNFEPTDKNFNLLFDGVEQAGKSKAKLPSKK